MQNRIRNQTIDLLRGISIFLVLLLHFQLAYHLGPTMDLIAGNGNYGVTMFFVISGFLITSISLKRYKNFAYINAYEFYSYRFARIIPCLMLALFLITVFHLLNVSIFQNKPAVSFTEAILSVLMFWHNILMQKFGYFNYCLNIYWSLSVEEVFYLAFPLITIFFKKKTLIIPFWIFLIILGPVFRSYHANDDIIALYANFSCFDAISIGCLCALVSDKMTFPRFVTLLAAGMMVFVYFSKGIMDNVILGPSVIALCTGILLINANKMCYENKFKTTQLISWLGKNSYEIYLFHIILLALIQSFIPSNTVNIYEKLILLFIFVTLSALVCNWIAKIYSEPLNQYFRKILAKPTTKILAAESCVE